MKTKRERRTEILKLTVDRCAATFQSYEQIAEATLPLGFNRVRFNLISWSDRFHTKVLKALSSKKKSSCTVRFPEPVNAKIRFKALITKVEEGGIIEMFFADRVSLM